MKTKKTITIIISILTISLLTSCITQTRTIIIPTNTNSSGTSTITNNTNVQFTTMNITNPPVDCSGSGAGYFMTRFTGLTSICTNAADTHTHTNSTIVSVNSTVIKPTGALNLSSQDIIVKCVNFTSGGAWCSG